MNESTKSSKNSKITRDTQKKTPNKPPKITGKTTYEYRDEELNKLHKNQWNILKNEIPVTRTNSKWRRDTRGNKYQVLTWIKENWYTYRQMGKIVIFTHQNDIALREPDSNIGHFHSKLRFYWVLNKYSLNFQFYFLMVSTWFLNQSSNWICIFFPISIPKINNLRKWNW